MPPASDLLASFLAGLSPEDRAALENAPDLDVTLDAIHAGASRAWPAVNLAPEVFFPYLAARVRGRIAGARSLGEIRAADLFLACACTMRDPAAIAQFEKRYLSEVDALLQAVAPSVSIPDVKQVLRHKLFVAMPGDEPKIAQYSGRADLRTWLRVMATREGINAVRRNKQDRGAGAGSALLEAVASNDDPELEHLKARYREDFKVAFEEALSSLSPRDRNILRHHLLDDLSIDQIGMIYGVHRATAARWIARIRQTLLARTREMLMRRLRVSEQEFESIVRLIRSQLDVSIRRHLQPGED